MRVCMGFLCVWIVFVHDVWNEQSRSEVWRDSWRYKLANRGDGEGEQSEIEIETINATVGM